MSFNRLKYDPNSYKQVLAESVGPLQYQLGTPLNCEECLSNDPNIRIQRAGASVDREMSMVDVNSELLNITRKLSNDPSKQYIPDEDKEGNLCTKSAKHHPRECSQYKTEYTLLSNPPCNLRGTGWNRWEWLCQDPQDKVISPYYFGTDTRQLAKDLHRPCIPSAIKDDNLRPLPVNSVLPVEEEEAEAYEEAPYVQDDSAMYSVELEEENSILPDGFNVPTGPMSTSWQNLDSIRQY